MIGGAGDKHVFQMLSREWETVPRCWNSGRSVPALLRNAAGQDKAHLEVFGMRGCRNENGDAQRGRAQYAHTVFSGTCEECAIAAISLYELPFVRRFSLRLTVFGPQDRLSR